MSSHKNPYFIAPFVALLGLGLATSAEAILINEIRIDQTGPDNDEYFELAGNAGESLDDLSYLVIGDSSSAGSGVVESATSLTGLHISGNGYFLAAESSFSLSTAPQLITSLNFENSDNVTHLLVREFSGKKGDDLDTNDDGLLDVIPWLDMLDSIALIETPSTGDKTYSPTQLGPDHGNVPFHVFRNLGSQGGWQIGGADTAQDTAGAANGSVSIPEPSSLTLLGLGWLMLRQTRQRIARQNPD